jgi:hypothetical protein
VKAAGGTIENASLIGPGPPAIVKSNAANGLPGVVSFTTVRLACPVLWNSHVTASAGPIAKLEPFVCGLSVPNGPPVQVAVPCQPAGTVSVIV